MPSIDYMMRRENLVYELYSGNFDMVVDYSKIAVESYRYHKGYFIVLPNVIELSIGDNDEPIEMIQFTNPPSRCGYITFTNPIVEIYKTEEGNINAKFKGYRNYKKLRYEITIENIENKDLVRILVNKAI